MKKYTLYKATCINGRHYIGYTSESFLTRQNRHLKHSRDGSKHYFHRALAVHKFKWEILIIVDSKQEALKLEKEYIIKFNSKVPNGYNLTDGGEGAPGFKRSKEQIDGMRKRMSIPIIRSDGVVYTSMTEAAESLNLKQANINKTILGLRATCGGFSWRRLDCKYDDIRILNRTRLINNKIKQYKKVIDNFGNIYNTVSSAGRKYNIPASHVSRVCRKQRKHCKGIIFNYYQGEENGK